ncbi:transposase [Terriglobus roseus]|nr:transposase [Terriglobus roseus]
MQVMDHVVLHVIFSTKNQRPTLMDDLRSEAFARMSEEIGTTENILIAIGGTADHVHVAVYLSRKMTVAKLVDRLKTAATRWIIRQGAKHEGFRWQKGFSVFSVSPADRNALAQYIHTQGILHCTRTFQQEMRAMYAKYDAGFDDRFVWK